MRRRNQQPGAELKPRDLGPYPPPISAPGQRPAPVRVMNGGELAAVVTSQAGQIDIRPEPGWKVTSATINVTVRRTRTRRKKEPPCNPADAATTE